MPDPTENTAPTNDEALEAPDLQPAPEEAIAALDAALQSQPRQPDQDPPPDSAPATPEGEGESDPDDNAPASEPPKPDDKKTVEPTDPAADDPAVEPAAKKPSDEFGELPKDAKEETRERFNSMKAKYDQLHEKALSAEAQASKWVETVQSTGANPEQFGMALSYLKDVNSGTRDGLERAYATMTEELKVIAQALGKPVPGVHDPLTLPENKDLQDRVEAGDMPTEAALEVAEARAARRFDHANSQRHDQQATQQEQAEAATQEIREFGAQMRASDPLYAQKMAVLGPAVKRLVTRLPPSEWATEVKALYSEVNVRAAPEAPAASAAPRQPAPIRPTAAPSGAGTVAKEPGSVTEAVNMALGMG